MVSRDVEYHAEHFDLRDPDFNDPDLPFRSYEVMRGRGALVFSDRPLPYPVEELKDARRWIAVGFGACDQILHDWEHFASDSSKAYEVESQGRPFIQLDPPLLQKYRKLLNPFFSPRRIERIEVKARAVMGEMIDEIIETGHGDLAAIAWRLPGVVLFEEILGLPTEEIPVCLELIDVVMHGGDDDVQRFFAAIDAFQHHLTALMKAKSEQPSGDSPFDMLFTTTEINGQPLSLEEIVEHAKLIISAGLETTSNALTNAYYYLGHHPAERERLIADPLLLPAAIEEVVRFSSSVHGINRIVTEDIEVAGCPLQRGDVVEVNYAAANRDPEAFADPDEFVLDREHNTHLGFGAGPHRCLGSNLARMELAVGLEEVLRRMPDYHVDDAHTTYVGTATTRGYTSLPVTFTPGSRLAPHRNAGAPARTADRKVVS